MTPRHREYKECGLCGGEIKFRRPHAKYHICCSRIVARQKAKERRDKKNENK